VGQSSWLNHLISTKDGNNVLMNMSMLFGTILSDQLGPDIEHETSNNVRCKMDWCLPRVKMYFMSLVHKQNTY